MWLKILQIILIFCAAQVVSVFLPQYNRISYSRYYKKVIEKVEFDKLNKCKTEIKHKINGISFVAKYSFMPIDNIKTISGSFSINSGETKFTIELQPKEFIKFTASLSNCKQNLEEWALNKRKSIQKLYIVKQNSMENTIIDYYAYYFRNVKEIEWKNLVVDCESGALYCYSKNVGKIFLDFVNTRTECEFYYNYSQVYCISQHKELHSGNLLHDFSQIWSFTKLIFQNCTFSSIVENDFASLQNIISLRVEDVDNYNFLSLKIVSHNLEYFSVDFKAECQHVYESIFTNLQSYKKLKLIYTDLKQFKSSYGRNLSAFVCDKNIDKCIFLKDKYKRSCPKGCECHLYQTKTIFNISCDRFEALTYVPIPTTGNISLYFENKHIRYLPNPTLDGYSNVRELHLANNNITHINLDQLPPNLTSLDLRNNNLRSLDKDVLEFLSNRAGIITIQLSGNPWTCNCDNNDLVFFISNFANSIEDRDQIRCSDQKFRPTMNIVKADLCGIPESRIITILLYLLGAAVTIVVIVVILYIKKSVMMCLYDRNLCLSCISYPEPPLEHDREYDAFLAFAHQDLGLIEEYVHKLEKCLRKYKLCFYQRDWLIGESISECILKSIDNSKRIIILLTQHFINSTWGTFEFQTAIRATSMDKEKRIIAIVYPDVKNFKKLDTELRLYLKFYTYLKRDDPHFWRKLFYSMPHTELPNDADVPSNIHRAEEGQA